MSIRSLKTWLQQGAHVAKPATNMPFLFLVPFYRLNKTPLQTSYTVIAGVLLSKCQIL